MRRIVTGQALVEDAPPDPFSVWMNLNMTRKLPMGVDLKDLDIKFHANTIIGRLYGHWAVMKRPGPRGTSRPDRMPPRYDLADEEGRFPPNPYRNDDGTPTKKFYDAYKVWHGYMLDIIASISTRKLGKDIHTGQEIDFLKPARELLGWRGGRPGTEIVQALKTAAQIDEAVLGPLKSGRGRDYANLMEILEIVFDDPSYEEAARDFWEISSGSRTLPAEHIDAWIAGGDVTELPGPSA
jgi:hypothetical protein